MEGPAPAASNGCRVAVVCDYLLDYLGGAQTALAQQVAALRQAGTETLVVAPSPGLVRPPALEPNGWCVPIRSLFTVPWVRLPLVRNTPALQRSLEELFRERSIEIVHVHSELGIAAAAMAAARRVGIPVVHTVHTFFWQTELPVQRVLATVVPRLHRRLTGLRASDLRLADRPGDSALRNMTLTIARQADVVVSPSRHQAERLRETGLEHVEIVPNALCARPTDEALVRVDGPLRLLWIGRCVQEKRILTFVRSVREALIRLGPGRLEVHIAGDGDQLRAARRLAEGRSEIVFHGQLDHEEVLHQLVAAHATVLTSYGFDNQPMTVVESIMALRGVVYCDPALHEGLQGPGIRVAGPSEEALVATLVSLAEDPAPVVAASQAAMRARGEFSPDTFVERIRCVYAAVRPTGPDGSSVRRCG